MHLWLLSHLVDSPGNRMFLEAAAGAGHDVRHVDPARVHLSVDQGGLRILGAAGPEPLPQVIFTRMGSSAPVEALHALRQLEAMGLPCINPSRGLLLARDKLATFQVIAGAGIPVPATALVGAGLPLDPVIEAVPGPPWIVKLPVSTQGTGVILAESQRSLRSICDTLHGVTHRVLVQRYVAESKGSDIRVLVIGGEAVAARRRSAQGDEFRSNLHRGGSATPLDVPEAAGRVAVQAAEALELPVAGVDLLEHSAEEFLVIEVNGSPGLEGLSAATGRDLALEIVRLLETAAS